MENDTDSLLQGLRLKMDISDEEYRSFHKLFEPRSFIKNEHVFKVGDIAGYVLFIVKGCMRIYTGNGQEKKSTLYFAEEGWWTGDIACMRSATPTELNLQAIEDCETLIISKDSWEYAYNSFPWFANFHTEGHLRWIAKLNSQIRGLLLNSPGTNYGRLVQERPGLVKRLPDYYLAVYLGIPPDELRRIKERFAE
jgi:CRP-like cAMP-binding protein